MFFVVSIHWSFQRHTNKLIHSSRSAVIGRTCLKMNSIYKVLLLLVTFLAILCVQRSSCQVDWGGIWPQAIQTTTIVSTTNQDPASITTLAFRACFDACQTVQHYNPVCGSDGITYNNQFRLQCAQRCGRRIQSVKWGTCSPLS
ncbi:unnamed protein product [Ceutorhynchus assimilis]|uniref:Kazal-like domain-containing protein n=1 Tax=Ceutorhynchus assimilis TaxID=467358 RepID=A0A9N9QQY5_9CUCU|nr:unnamed protein product [Ceutorhynchus assimilis]